MDADRAILELQHYERVYSRYLQHTCGTKHCRMCRREARAYKSLKKACEQLNFDLISKRSDRKKEKPKKSLPVAEISVGPESRQNLITALEEQLDSLVDQAHAVPEPPPEDD